ncbi:hypothetical protein H206_01871 [Candidatus Electrothrix aarhusensis]|uniref:Uncharacterized protein n=1 Tax=Candidatus Electrothrix aarhusensis TaxID=1859131 RepID=A0A3S3SJP6_9BACT|nr:hypothetical protein H206_01871 [Candidatus Electrothrix aarhusensis]
MKNKWHLLLLIFTWCSMTSSKVLAEDIFTMQKITLYNQMDIFSYRCSPDVDSWKDFVQQVKEKAAGLWVGTSRKKSENGLIAVAIIPEKKMKLWLDIEGSFRANLTESLTRKLKDVKIPLVQEGPIAFSIHFSLHGDSTSQKDGKIILPESWLKAAKKQARPVLIPDEILPLVWDEAAKPITEPPYIPEGYILQVLEPFGGTIIRPQEWFYTESHRPQHYTWKVTKEDAKLGPYETGVMIQALLGIKEHTGKTPKQFVLSFIEEKKKNAKILSESSERNVGLFTRVCLETEEEIKAGTISQQHHIMYSLFWEDKMDIVAISIAGTPVDLYEKNKKILNSMNSFELIDMKRFSSSEKQTKQQ